MIGKKLKSCCHYGMRSIKLLWILGLVMPLISTCGSGGGGEFASDSGTEDELVDTRAPLAGSDLTFSSHTASSIAISWGAATDETSTTARLQYRLVRAVAAESIDTASEVSAVTGSNLLVDWTTASLSYTDTAASENATFFYNVAVRDEKGNISIYTPQSASTYGLWEFQSYMTAPNLDDSDVFGIRVALSGDTVAFCSSSEDENSGSIVNGESGSVPNLNASSSVGAVYVYRRSGTDWAFESYLKSPAPDASNYLCLSDLDMDDDTIVAATLFDDESFQGIEQDAGSVPNTDGAGNSGAVTVFKRTGTTWAFEAFIKAPNAQATDFFGTSAAIDGDTLVVGASGEDENFQGIITSEDSVTNTNTAADSGAVYVYRRTGSTWAFEAYIKPPNNSAGDSCGREVDISGDRLVFSCTGEDEASLELINDTSANVPNNDDGSNQGAVYVYRRTGSTWSFEAYLKAPNGAANDGFGTDVAIDNNRIAVGAENEDEDSSTIVNTGIPPNNDGADSSGAVYTFVRSGDGWEFESYLKSPRHAAFETFGSSLSLSDDTLIVGVDADDETSRSITNFGETVAHENAGAQNGAVFVFRNIASGWALESIIKAPNSDEGDSLGLEAKVDGDFIAAASRGDDEDSFQIINGGSVPDDDGGSATGSGFIFVR